MTCRIGYNIHAQRVTERNKLMKHLATIQPAAVLVMDGVQLAREIKAMLPSTTVISRIYPDEDIQNHTTPEQWLDQRGPQAERRAGLDTDAAHEIAGHVADQPARFRQRNRSSIAFGCKRGSPEIRGRNGSRFAFARPAIRSWWSSRRKPRRNLKYCWTGSLPKCCP